MNIEQRMDDARIPRDAQNKTVLEFDGCRDVREYVTESGNRPGEGISFIFANDCKNTDSVMTFAEAKMLVQVFAKELILTGQTVQIINPPRLATWLKNVKPWEEEFDPDYSQHLILTNFYRDGQLSPYEPKELNCLLDYIGERVDYRKTVHTFAHLTTDTNWLTRIEAWYPRIWVEYMLDVNMTKWIKKS